MMIKSTTFTPLAYRGLINLIETHLKWGLSHGNLFSARLLDHEETWKYTNGS